MTRTATAPPDPATLVWQRQPSGAYRAVDGTRILYLRPTRTGTNPPWELSTIDPARLARHGIGRRIYRDLADAHRHLGIPHP